MTDSCCPPPGTAPGSWHWLERDGQKPAMYHWDGELWCEEDRIYPPDWMWSKRWRYHSAVPEPDEVEALRRVVLTLWRAEEPGGIFPAMKAAGLLDPTADYAQFSLTPLGRRALGFAEGEGKGR